MPEGTVLTVDFEINDDLSTRYVLSLRRVAQDAEPPPARVPSRRSR